MPENSPLSYQTTMPDPIDISYQAYSKELGLSGPRFIQAIAAWGSGKPSYEQWQTAKQNDYNQRLSAYNTWLSTGAGQRASALSGNYNPSYFGLGSASASPVDYQVAPEANGFNEIAQGASGLFDILQALKGFELTNAQIEGQQLDNEHKRIENRILPALLLNRSNLYGYQAGGYKFNNEINLARRYGVPQINPKTGLLDGTVMNFANMDYNLMDADKAFGYQQAVQDLTYRGAAEGLQRINAQVSALSAKEKNFYINEVLPWVKVQAIETAGLTSARRFNVRAHTRLMRKQGKKLGIQNIYEKQLKELEVKGKKYGLTKTATDTVLGIAKEARGWVETFVPKKTMRM